MFSNTQNTLKKKQTTNNIQNKKIKNLGGGRGSFVLTFGKA
jgi:hypothetical protein